jgi:hypothetical protein
MLKHALDRRGVGRLLRPPEAGERYEAGNELLSVKRVKAGPSRGTRPDGSGLAEPSPQTTEDTPQQRERTLQRRSIDWI